MMFLGGFLPGLAWIPPDSRAIGVSEPLGALPSGLEAWPVPEWPLFVSLFVLHYSSRRYLVGVRF